MKKIFLCVIVLLAVILLMPVMTNAALIPPERLVAWQGNVGVEGGIPSRTTQIDCTASPYNAHADGLNTASNIQACLNGIGANQVAYLPVGNYTLTATINMPSNKTLRGAGMDSTILLFTTQLGTDISIYGGYTDVSQSPGVSIVSGYTKGSNQLVLSSASGFVPGSFVYITELNDPSIPVSGLCNYCGLYGAGGTRTRLQLAKVTAVNGNIITIDIPMYFTFSSSNSPQANRAPFNYVQYAGIEDLTIKNVGTSLSSARKNVFMQGAANCWVKNVKAENCGTRCVHIWDDVYRNEIRDSFFLNVIDQVNSDKYAVEVWGGSGNLVENNLFNNTANGILTVSASGNVFAYNYMHGVHRLANVADWFWPDSWTHGEHSSYNLWEGNDQTALEWDFYWGSNSHNIAFRNRFHGMDATINYDLLNLQAVGAIQTFPDNNYMTNIGNILGTSGFSNMYEGDGASGTRPVWRTVRSYNGVTSDQEFTTTLRHMNYDYFTNSVKHCGDAGEPGCQGGDGSTSLPASLYFSSKPAWWGNLAWPAIGPDLNPMNGTIPAKQRYDAMMSGSNPVPVPGDLDGDGFVNEDDFFIVASDFGKSLGFNNAKSDTNSDGIVDIYDVVYVASRFS